MPYHCDTCAKHPDAFRLGYANMITGSKPMAVAEIQMTMRDQDEPAWWTAYYHGRSLAKATLTASSYEAPFHFNKHVVAPCTAAWDMKNSMR